MTEYYIIAVDQCPTCQGEGIIYDPHCRLCNERIPSGHPWFSTSDDTMPCGHSGRKFFVDEYDCPNCDGTGILRREIPFQEALSNLQLQYPISNIQPPPQTP